MLTNRNAKGMQNKMLVFDVDSSGYGEILCKKQTDEERHLLGYKTQFVPHR
jgi:hypothetical protein